MSCLGYTTYWILVYLQCDLCLSILDTCCHQITFELFVTLCTAYMQYIAYMQYMQYIYLSILLPIQYIYITSLAVVPWWWWLFRS